MCEAPRCKLTAPESLAGCFSKNKRGGQGPVGNVMIFQGIVIYVGKGEGGSGVSCIGPRLFSIYVCVPVCMHRCAMAHTWCVP